jgi:hypothetical protein
MNLLHARALKVLGRVCLAEDGLGQFDPPEAELIGLLMLELDRLTGGDFALEGRNWKRKIDTAHVGRNAQKRHGGIWTGGAFSYLEALVLAVEAAKEGE